MAGESGISGAWAYLLSKPTVVLVDEYNDLFILDTGNRRIVKWTLGWKYGFTVALLSSMNEPYGMYFNSFRDIIVADASTHAVYSFMVDCCEYYIDIRIIFNVIGKDLCMRFPENSVIGVRYKYIVKEIENLALR